MSRYVKIAKIMAAAFLGAAQQLYASGGAGETPAGIFVSANAQISGAENISVVPAAENPPATVLWVAEGALLSGKENIYVSAEKKGEDPEKIAEISYDKDRETLSKTDFAEPLSENTKNKEIRRKNITQVAKVNFLPSEPAGRLLSGGVRTVFAVVPPDEGFRPTVAAKMENRFLAEQKIAQEKKTPQSLSQTGNNFLLKHIILGAAGIRPPPQA